MAYYQPNVFHYHSTPWRYRWGRYAEFLTVFSNVYARSADVGARERREARLAEVPDLASIPVSGISAVASNVSVAYSADIWQNDMVYKDQDDCSKRLLCELNARAAEGAALSETEELIAQVTAGACPPLPGLWEEQQARCWQGDSGV